MKGGARPGEISSPRAGVQTLTMSKNKQQRKPKDRRNKVHDDGKAIADLQEAVHKLKKELANGAYGTTGHRGGRSNYDQSLGKLVSLMGDEERFDAAYSLCLIDCDRYPARIPPSQTLGYVPVDLYRKRLFNDVVIGSSGFGFSLLCNDGWNSSTVVGNETGFALLPASGETGVAGTYSTSSYASTSTPSNYATLPTGAANLTISDVSESFSSNANTGTEYIMVACVSELTAKLVPGSSAANSYFGVVYAVTTLDPERYNISAENIGALQSAAAEENSSVFVRAFTITSDGLFVPQDQLVDGESGPLLAFASLKSIALPMDNMAFDWRRIGSRNFANTANAVNNPTHGFIIEGAAGTTFQQRTTFLWQTEEYPSNLVHLGSDQIANQIEHQISQIGSSGFDKAIHHFQSHGGGRYAPMVVGTTPTTTPGAITNGNTWVDSNRSFVQTTHCPPAPKPKKRLQLAGASGQPARNEGRPTALNSLVPHAAPRIGLPIHPAAAHASVIADRCRQAGFHRQLASAMTGPKSVVPPALANFFGAEAPEICRALCGPGGGAEAMEVVASNESNWWQDLASGVSSIAGIVGPLLSLL